MVATRAGACAAADAVAADDLPDSPDLPDLPDLPDSPHAPSIASAHITITFMLVRALGPNAAPVRRSAVTPEDSRHLILRIQHGVHLVTDLHCLLRDLRNTLVGARPGGETSNVHA